MNVVILERVEPGVTPSHCVHGRATCVACSEWVWLGSATFGPVEAGEVRPMCTQCAERIIGPSVMMRASRRLRDH